MLSRKISFKLKTLESQQATLAGRQEVLEQRLKTKSTILSEMTALVEQGGFQRLQYLEQQDQVFEMQTQVNDLAEQRNRLQLQADQIRLQSRKSINQMRNQLQKAEVQLQYQNVIAPVAGVVFDPQARVDGVLGVGERILSIVPQQGLYAKCLFQKDIGFVNLVNPRIRVMLSIYSLWRIQAVVSQIAADALEPNAFGFYNFPVN